MEAHISTNPFSSHNNYTFALSFEIESINPQTLFFTFQIFFFLIIWDFLQFHVKLLYNFTQILVFAFPFLHKMAFGKDCIKYAL